MKIIKDIATPIDMANITAIARIKPNGYVLLETEEDISSNMQVVEALMLYSIYDYNGMRGILMYLAPGFASLSDEAKLKVCEHCAVDDSTIIGFYMAYYQIGQMEATILFAKNKSTQVTESAACCERYVRSPKIKLVLLSSMPRPEAERLMDETMELMELCTTGALYGQKYGDSLPGIMDYLEDYGEYQGKGLSTYSLYPGVQLADVVAALVDVIMNGNLNM